MQDSMPPLTLDQMIAILENPNFKTYLVFGEESDDIWSMATAAQRFLPGVRSYLVKLAAQEDVKQSFDIPQDHVAIVFGRSSVVAQTLTIAQASDFLTVTEAISNA
jgi:hypothetical protein